MAKLAFSLFLLLQVLSAFSSPTKIDRSLIHTLTRSGKADIVITLSEETSTSVLSTINSTPGKWASRGEKITSMVSLLKAKSQAAQQDILSFLTSKQAPEKGEAPMKFESVHSFWIMNKLVVRGANLELVKQLQSRSDVASIELEKLYQMGSVGVEVGSEKGSSRVIPGTEQPNIALIRAPPCWAYGQQGENAVVASIGTGVRATHEAIRDNYRNQSGWFDAVSSSLEPNDENGYGTHEMGVMVGTNGIGVAPKAKFISCKGCSSIGCSVASLLKCSEFILCPTDAQGGNADCSLAPQVVINGWGGGSNDPWFNEALLLWREGGILPIFPIGGSGSGCGTAGSPADSQYAVAVAATTLEDSTTSISSRGPTADGRIKPEVAAPGLEIFSAISTSDTAYAAFSGSTAGTAHAGGVAALIASERSDLSVDEVEELLLSGALPVTPAGQTCGGIPDDEYPNNSVGHGRIDALRSVAGARKYQKH